MNIILKKTLNYFNLLPRRIFSNNYVSKANDINFFINLNKILKKNNINLTLDIGANIGHYSLILRKTGFDKKIIAFEPLKEYYLKSKKTLSKEKNVFVEQLALGNINGQKTINVASNNGLSSSFLKFNKNEIFVEEKRETVKIKKIEDYLSERKINSKNIFMKLDVQGYELEILKSINDFNRFKVIQIEASFISFYKNQVLFKQLNDFMEEKGYDMSLIKNNGYTRDGEVKELDIIYSKR